VPQPLLSNAALQTSNGTIFILVIVVVLGINSNMSSRDHQVPPLERHNPLETSISNQVPPPPYQRSGWPTPPKASTPLWPLRYRKRSVLILAVYLALLIIPWVFTCVLAVRPLDHASYIKQSASYTKNDLLDILASVNSIRILNTITSILTVPLLSAILAQAVVVYTQRRTAGQQVSVRQAFVLADRGWENPKMLWSALFANGGGSLFLWIAAGVMLLGA
jgi:hypothetical protein